MNNLPSFAPRLAQQHPGYFKVVLSLLMTHLALALDASRINPTKSPVFLVLYNLLGGHVWMLTVAHLIVFFLLLIGLYVRGLFHLLRFGAALSAVIFNVFAAALIFSASANDLSYALPIACVALSLSSIAAAKEPEEGPRSVR